MKISQNRFWDIQQKLSRGIPPSVQIVLKYPVSQNKVYTINEP